MRQKFVSHPIYQLTRTCVIRMLSFQVLKGCKRDEIKRRQLLIFSLLETSGEKGKLGLGTPMHFLKSL